MTDKQRARARWAALAGFCIITGGVMSIVSGGINAWELYQFEGFTALPDYAFWRAFRWIMTPVAVGWLMVILGVAWLRAVGASIVRMERDNA